MPTVIQSTRQGLPCEFLSFSTGTIPVLRQVVTVSEAAKPLASQPSGRVSELLLEGPPCGCGCRARRRPSFLSDEHCTAIGQDVEPFLAVEFGAGTTAIRETDSFPFPARVITLPAASIRRIRCAHCR